MTEYNGKFLIEHFVIRGSLRSPETHNELCNYSSLFFID